MQKNILFSVFLIFLISIPAYSQTPKGKGSVKGRAVFTDKTPAAFATASVRLLPDSSLVSYTLTNEEGNFELKNLAKGDYLINVNLTGSQLFVKAFSITDAMPNADLGILIIEEFTVKGAIVKGQLAPVEIKQDTVDFDAKAFKTKPNANLEDLLKKLPGVEVAKDGTVKAQGETVKKIFVDGKPFFTDDPKTATKNLPASMIERVQVIDQLSDQSQFTGVDDGNREKVINITTKKDSKKGGFGNVLVGGGTNERYESNLSYNRFRNNRQFSIIGGANNVNTQNFTSGGGTFGGGGGGMGGAGANIQSLLGNIGGTNNTPNGITKALSGGLNYNDQINNNSASTISANYLFNDVQTDAFQDSKRQNFLQNGIISTFADNANTTKAQNHRLNFRLNFDLDSANTIRFIPNLSVTTNKYDASSTSKTVNNEQNQLNSANTLNDNKNVSLNFSNRVQYRHKFKKRGRTFSSDFVFTGTSQNGDNFNDATNNFSLPVVTTLRTRQKSAQENHSLSYQFGVSYTEPVSRKRSLEFNYNYSSSNTATGKLVFDYNESVNSYSNINTRLTNVFDNDNNSHRLGTNLITQKLKYNYSLGFAVQTVSLDNQNVTTNINYKRDFFNVFPSAQFRYNFGKNRRLILNYNGRTNQPSSTQLQPVVDNSNPLSVTTGNPNLDREVINTLRANYSSYNMTTFRSIFGFMTVSNTANKIVTNTNIDASGRQITQYTNTNGIYNVAAFGGMGIPLVGNSFTLNLTTNILWNRNKSFINNNENITNNYIAGQGVRLNWNYKESLDLALTGNISYSVADYSLQSQNNVKYTTATVGLDATYTFKNGIILAVDVDYYTNYGLAAGFNQEYTILNGSIAKQIFKNKSGELRLRVYDGLKQNISINRSASDTYIQDTSNMVLQRYFMLSFRYNINAIAQQQQSQGNNNQRGR